MKKAGSLTLGCGVPRAKMEMKKRLVELILWSGLLSVVGYLTLTYVSSWGHQQSNIDYLVVQ